MNRLASLLARMLGYDSTAVVEQPEFKWAGWVDAAPLAPPTACAVLAAAGLWFYLKFQPLTGRRLKIGLACLRATLLCLIVLILAEPTLVVQTPKNTKPSLFLLFDGSSSMAIDDAPATSTGASGPGNTRRPTRLDQLQAILNRDNGDFIRRLNEKFDLHAFQFSAGKQDSFIALTQDEPGQLEGSRLAKQLKADGDTTRLGDALTSLRPHVQQASTVGGVVLFSDYNFSPGSDPMAAKGSVASATTQQVPSPAELLKKPLFCVGFGPKHAVDIKANLQAPLLMKNGESSTLTAILECDSLTMREVTVRLTAKPVGSAELPQLIEERNIQINEHGTEQAKNGGAAESAKLSINVPFSYVPTKIGRYEFTASVIPQPDETIVENNVSSREVNIRDDFLHLMFVDYEPNWEWRFIKEVFHRDSLVGLRGFRTFLRSADPKVRQTNELFLPSLPPPRNEFFVNDVIFLGDMPATSLSTRYCEMVKEFVDKFGGGLVILCGPNFGPAELAATPLGDLLPVRTIPGGKMADQKREPFVPKLTDAAAEFDFMRLVGDAEQNRQLWARLGPLDWYQPVAGVRIEAGTQVLLEHPTAKCADNRTPQPILAVRPYGKGEVVYLAMNETWRLRREYGEKYYRQFWGQMIHRLGLRHALGDQKRFVLKIDRKQYRTGERVPIVVDGYDQNYEPLNLSKLQPALTHLSGELVLPTVPAGGGPTRKPLRLTQFREGEFHVNFDVLEPGEYVVRVRDPLTGEFTEAALQVTSGSLERQTPNRNTELQYRLAALNAGDLGAGEAFEPEEIDRLIDRIPVPPRARGDSDKVEIELWNTWPAFLLVVMLMLVEWFIRKWKHLA